MVRPFKTLVSCVGTPFLASVPYLHMEYHAVKNRHLPEHAFGLNSILQNHCLVWDVTLRFDQTCLKADPLESCIE